MITTRLIIYKKLLAVSVALLMHTAYADESMAAVGDTLNVPQTDTSLDSAISIATEETTAAETKTETTATETMATKAITAKNIETRNIETRNIETKNTATKNTATKTTKIDSAAESSTKSGTEKEEIETEAKSTETEAKTAEKTGALIIPEYQAREEDQALATTKKTENVPNGDEQQDEEQPKDGYFKRLYHRYFGGEEVVEIAKIVVAVNLVDAALAENVQAALSEITVEEFSDFKSALPRIRAVARDAAQAVGYYDADFVFKKEGDSFMDVTITPNEPVKITKSNLEVQGGEQADPIKKLLDDHELQVGKVFNHRSYEQLKQRITLAAKQMGFFDANWQTANVTVQLPENTAEVTMVFQTGKRYRFGEVIFLDKQGKAYATSQVKDQVEVNEEILRQMLPFKQGDVFEQKKITEYSNGLLNTQYFNAVDIDVRKPEVKKPDEAIKSTVVFSQKEKQDASENEALATQADKLAKPAKKMGIPAIKPQLKVAKKPYQIPIVVTLDSSKPNTAELGLGYGTDTGMRVRGKLSRNLFNKKGHKIRLNTEVSSVKQAAVLKYEKPFKDPLNDTLTYFVGYEREKRDSGLGIKDIDIDTITTGVRRNVQTGNWRHTFSMTYYLDKIDNVILENIENLPARFQAGSQKQQLLMLGYRLDRTHLRGGIYPYRGVKQYYQIEAGAKRVVSDADLAILRTGISGLYSFGDNRYDELSPHQVVGRIDAASIVTNNFDDVPYKQRFFAGGDRSIRGYDYKSLSPTDDDGFLLGGQHLLVASAEYSHLVADKWRAAVFVDAGNAYDADFSNGTKVGAGFGVRWLSPIGLVRVDLAAGVSETKLPIRLHFFIGPPL